MKKPGTGDPVPGFLKPDYFTKYLVIHSQPVETACQSAPKDPTLGITWKGRKQQ